MATLMTIYCCRRETSLIVSPKEPSELSLVEVEALSVACSKCGREESVTGELASAEMPAISLW